MLTDPAIAIREGSTWTWRVKGERWRGHYYANRHEALHAATRAIRGMDIQTGRIKRIGVDEFAPRLMAERLLCEMADHVVELTGDGRDGYVVQQNLLQAHLEPIMAHFVAQVQGLCGDRYEVLDIEDHWA